MRFVTIDVETANSDLASICDVALITFDEHQVSETWQSLLDPEDIFSDINTSIHRINSQSIESSPTFPKVYEAIKKRLKGNIVVSHGCFDRISISKVVAKYKLDPIECRWLDSSTVVRRAWPEFSRKGYGLRNIANFLGIEFEHHRAMEDARVCGEVLIKATELTKIPVERWIDSLSANARDRNTRAMESSKNSHPSNLTSIQEGILSGEIVVFTGTLSFSRKIATQYAQIAGCEVANSVNNETTLVVIGEQDIRRLGGHEKSTKHRRAEELLQLGSNLRIIGEADFTKLIGLQ